MANAAHIEHEFPVRRNRKSLLEEFVSAPYIAGLHLQTVGELELLHLLSQFFDRALYYTAVGYERDRIGGAREMSRDNSHSVPTGGNSCFPQYPWILTSRASTSSLSSVVLPRKYTLSLRIYV